MTWHHVALAVLVIAARTFSARLAASRADFINVWCETGSFLTSTAHVLSSRVRGADHSLGPGGGVGFRPAVRQAERANKAPYCPPPPFEDGVNWPYKRHQGKVLLKLSWQRGSLFLVVVGGAVYTAGPQTGCDKIPWSGLDYTSAFDITSRALEGKAEEPGWRCQDLVLAPPLSVWPKHFKKATN